MMMIHQLLNLSLWLSCLAAALLSSAPVVVRVSAFSPSPSAASKYKYIISESKSKSSISASTLFAPRRSRTATATGTTRSVAPSCLAMSTTTPPPSSSTSSTTSTTPTASSSSSSSTSTYEQNQSKARIVFVTGSAPSQYGATSPLPDPTWFQVAQQLAKRLPHFVQVRSKENDGEESQEEEDTTTTTTVETHVINLASSSSLSSSLPSDTNVVVVLGVATPSEQEALKQLLLLRNNSKNKNSNNNNNNNNNHEIQAVLCDPTCAPEIFQERFVGTYHPSTINPLQSLYIQLVPWSTLASHQRLLQKADTLLARKSSEDYIFSLLFVLDSLDILSNIDVVKNGDINPSWEKGVGRNIKEFQTMVNCCGPQIQAALSDPQSKKAIDLLNDLDLRDQVGSYRVIVSNETPQLEDFTLCILQQNNCFQCDSPILQQPRVPLLKEWPRGKPLDHIGARQILLGHLEHPDSSALKKRHNDDDDDDDIGGGRHPWSWKIVVGANPAYDAFPMQHQIFYPAGSSSSNTNTNTNTNTPKSMWYDPVFCVETLDGDLVWCKRHYRCTPRKHWSASSSSSSSPGAWTLTTLDNGMVSEEHWTTVDAADDLSWTVLHYSGAARRAGQSYVGALLCSPDGKWPQGATPGTPEWDRIQTAFRNCDLEMWELFGGSVEESYMWSSKFTDWAETHPPPLNRIGDMSITTWRKRMREKEAQESSKSTKIET